MNRFSFQLSIRLIILFLSLNLFSANVIARPLKPLTSTEYSNRMKDLTYAPLNSESVNILNTTDFSGCQIDDIQIVVEDPMTHLEHIVKVAVFHPYERTKVAAILIVPTIFGRTLLEDGLAYRICKKDMVAVIADINSIEPPSVLPDWQLHDRNNRLAVLDLRTILDLVEAHPQVDPQQIAGLGLSLGAFSVALLSSVDSRLKAVALIAGAGNMPSILTLSLERVPKKLRTLRMDALGDYSLENYENNLRENIKYDPIYLSVRPQPSKYFMLVNLTDADVPSENQDELWVALGKPQRLDVSATHLQTILASVTVHFDEIFNNIVSRLNQ